MRFSFGRFTDFQPDSGLNSSVSASDLGILEIPRPPVAAGYGTPPAFNFDGFSTLNPNTFNWSATTYWNVQPNAVHTRGRHVYHFGAEFSYATIGSTQSGKANGDLTFNRSWTQQWVNGRDGVSRNTGPLDGSSVADLLLGAPGSGYVDYNDTFYRSWPYWGFYFQDTWKILPKVTLNLGLRYDVQVPLKERFNRINAGFDATAKNPLSDQIVANWQSLKQRYDATHPLYPYPNAPSAIYGGPLFAGGKGVSQRPYDTDWTDIQPRIGVAWNFAPRTVLRGGAGIFYRTADQLNQTIGFNRRTPLYLFHRRRGTHGRLDRGILAGEPVSARFERAQRGLTRAGERCGRSDRVRWPAAADSAHLPVFPGSAAGTALGGCARRELFRQPDGSRLYDVVAGVPSAVDFARGTADPNYLNRQLPNPFLNLIPATSTLGDSIVLSAYDLLRAYPLFDGVQKTTNPWARYRYDALQVFAQRKIKDLGQAGEFFFLLSYTYSKSIQEANRLNDWNLAEKPVKELNPLDKPHTFALSGLWELPYGWGRKYGAGIGSVKGFFLNGWAVDWILTYNSGYPVAQPDAIFNCGNYAAAGGQTQRHWFNNDAACWSARPQYTLRTSPDVFSTIRNPAAAQLHSSVEKTWWVTDKYTLQLRGESFNVTNTPIVRGPTTDYRDSRFGQLTNQQNNFPRLLQIGLRILF